MSELLLRLQAKNGRLAVRLLPLQSPLARADNRALDAVLRLAVAVVARLSRPAVSFPKARERSEWWA